MKHIALAILLSFTAQSALAADVVQQRYIDQLTRGGMVSAKQAAQSIVNTSETSTEVLDVAAEVMLQRYPSAGRGDIDALAWLTRALGNSGNARYHDALLEVASNSKQKKLVKYASKALQQIGSDGAQYKKGTVSLEKLRNSKPKAAAAPAASANNTSTGGAGLDIVRIGMSMQEVYDLIGPPTATTNRQTGKAWNPFNYSGSDVMRSISLYKGKGRVIFSNSSRYSGHMKVIEVVIDPNETGYP